MDDRLANSSLIPAGTGPAGQVSSRKGDVFKWASARKIFRDSWEIYRRSFWVIAAVVLVIWLPIDLVLSYVDKNVLGPEDYSMSFKCWQFANGIFGIIASAAVISVANSACLGETPGARGSLDVGRAAWERMFWARWVMNFLLLIGVLFLVVPGIILIVRLALVEPIVVCERVHIGTAIRRSFELTRGRFWQVGLMGLVLGIGMVLLMIICYLPSVLVPGLDNWIVDTVISCVTDVAAAFWSVFIMCAYAAFSKEQRL